MNPDFPKKIPVRRQYQPPDFTGDENLATLVKQELSVLADMLNEMAPAYGELSTDNSTGHTVTTTAAAIPFVDRWPDAGEERGVSVVGAGPYTALVADKIRGVFRIAYGAEIYATGAAVDWFWDLYVNGVARGRGGTLAAFPGAEILLLGEHFIPLNEGDEVELRVSISTGTRGFDIRSAFMTMQRIA